jgi:hypothetical protein
LQEPLLNLLWKFFKMEFNIDTHEGEYDLSASVRLIGPDVLVAIWGGEKPHIGAVAMSPQFERSRGNECNDFGIRLCGPQGG